MDALERAYGYVCAATQILAEPGSSLEVVELGRSGLEIEEWFASRGVKPVPCGDVSTNPVELLQAAAKLLAAEDQRVPVWLVVKIQELGERAA